MKTAALEVHFISSTVRSSLCASSRIAIWRPQLLASNRQMQRYAQEPQLFAGQDMKGSRGRTNQLKHHHQLSLLEVVSSQGETRKAADDGLSSTITSQRYQRVSGGQFTWQVRPGNWRWTNYHHRQIAPAGLQFTWTLLESVDGQHMLVPSSCWQWLVVFVVIRTFLFATILTTSYQVSGTNLHQLDPLNPGQGTLVQEMANQHSQLLQPPVVVASLHASLHSLKPLLQHRHHPHLYSLLQQPFKLGLLSTPLSISNRCAHLILRTTSFKSKPVVSPTECNCATSSHLILSQIHNLPSLVLST